jgi:hypothetical protein
MLYDSNYGVLTRWDRTRLGWREFGSILRAMNRQSELERLVEWARRKKLPGPLRCYQSRLEDEARRVMRYSLSSPSLARWARRVYRLNKLIWPPPRYYARGSAVGYSRKGITGKKGVL